MSYKIDPTMKRELSLMILLCATVADNCEYLLLGGTQPVASKNPRMSEIVLKSLLSVQEMAKSKRAKVLAQKDKICATIEMILSDEITDDERETFLQSLC
jgi:hypothetical protein